MYYVRDMVVVRGFIGKCGVVLVFVMLLLESLVNVE